VHTGAARSVAEHPIRALWDAGVSLSFNTDNRLMSRISQTDEAEVLMRDAGFTPGDLLRMSMHGAKANFIHPDFGWQFEYRARQHAEANGIAL
jgi:adenosine deaminase